MDEVINNLNYLCKTYDGLNKLIVSTKNRLQALNKDADPKHQDEIRLMDSLKGKLIRRIEKELDFWPVWTDWLIKIPGVGPFIAGNLILLYYYRFMPICPKCETVVEKKEGTFYCNTCERSVKGDGISTYKIEYKDFNQVSSWWHYMGRHIIDGKMPKRKKGVQSTWSTKGRTIGFQIGDQFNRQNGNHLYKNFMLDRKKKRGQTHSEASKGHQHNMARNEVIKLFLSHFWHVAREIAGKSTEGPWIIEHGGHGHFIAPYYWDSHLSFETQRENVSQRVNETHGSTASQLER